eukprot:gene10390-2522_t
MPRGKNTLKPLTGKLNKDELAKRLQNMLETLQNEIENDTPLPHHVVQRAADLVHPTIMRNKDSHVRLLAAQCLAELLNHPIEMPFDVPEQRKIFNLFVEELRGLNDPKGPYFSGYFSLLETLANSGTFRLCHNLEATGTLQHLFQVLFGVISPRHSSKVASDISDILATLIEDGFELTDEILDIIFQPMLPKFQNKSPAAAELSKSLLQRCVPQLQLSIHTYFNGLLGLTGETESSLVDEAYVLIEQVAYVDPAILVRVLPQLEHQLKMKDLNQRKRATLLLGRIFGKAQISAAAQFRSLWAMFLQRAADIHVEIRTTVCDALFDIITNYPQSLGAECFDKLRSALMDADERVRLSAASVVEKLCKSHPSLLSPDFVQHFASRRLDKKPSVRRITLNALAVLFTRLIDSLSDTSVIPDQALFAANQLGLAVRRPDIDDRQRVKEFLTDMPSANQAVDDFNRDGEENNEEEDRNSDTNTSRLDIIMSKRLALARMLPGETQHNLDQLEKLALSKDTNLHKLLVRLCQEDEYLSAEEVANIENLKQSICSNSGQLKSLVLSLSVLTAPLVLDPELLEKTIMLHSHFNDLTLSGRTLAFINHAAIRYPRRIAQANILAHLSKLLTAITIRHRQLGPTIRTEQALQTMYVHVFELHRRLGFTLSILILGSLEDCLPLCKNIYPFATYVRFSLSFKQPLQHLAVSTDDPSEAKHVVKTIVSLFPQFEEGDGDSLLHDVAERYVAQLDLTSTQLLSSLKALGYIALLAPSIYTAIDREVTVEFVVKGLLMNNSEPELEEPPEDAPEWTDSPTIECQAKVLGIKLLVRRLLGKAQYENITDAELENAARPSIRILAAILEGTGNLQEDSITPLIDRSRLRLASGCAFLKLAQFKRLQPFIDIPLFQQLAALVQDSCVEVRRQFCVKLERGLDALHKLPLSYMAMFILSAIDPNPDCREQSAVLLRTVIKKRRKFAALLPKEFQPLHHPEYVLPYVVHLIAHHPDFSMDETSLRTAEKYLNFLFDQLCTKGEEEYTFLKALVETMKLAEDRHAQNSQLLTWSVFQSSRPGWTLKTFPGEVALPVALFTKPTQRNVQSLKSVLPDTYQLSEKTPKQQMTPHKTSPRSSKKTPQPTRRNAPRSAKKTNISLADIDDDEIERQALRDHTLGTSRHVERTRKLSSESERLDKNHASDESRNPDCDDYSVDSSQVSDHASIASSNMQESSDHEPSSAEQSPNQASGSHGRFKTRVAKYESRKRAPQPVTSIGLPRHKSPKTVSSSARSNTPTDSMQELADDTVVNSPLKPRRSARRRLAT